MLKNNRPIKFFIAVVVSIFATEFGISTFIIKYMNGNGLSVYDRSILDPLLLIIVVSPVLYYFFLKPLLKETNERKLSEKFLSASKAKIEEINEDLRKFKLAIDNTGERVTITDPDGIVLYVNPATEKITGYKPEEAIGKKAGALWRLPMPREYYEKLWHTIRGKKEMFRGELKNRRKNGEIYDAITTISPVLNEKEEVIFFVEVENDITERKKAEEELRSQEMLFNALTQNSPDCIKLFDKKGNLVFMNNEGLREHGYKNVEEAIKKGMNGTTETMLPESSNAFKRAFDAAIGGKASSIEVRHSKEGSSREFCLESITPIREESGEISGILGISRDITKSKEMEKLKSDFLTLASHQLRTPLSGTRWLIETLNKPFIGKLNKKQKEYLDELYKVNAKMLALVSDLLNLLRLESGDLAVSIKKVTVAEFSDDVLAMMENAAKNKGVVLKGIPKEKGKIAVDTDFQIVVNILESFVSNSIEYSRTGEEVFLDAEETKDSVILSVRDTGIGIPKDEQNRIFERFYRASNAKSIRPGGTGLGLSIASILAQKIGAKLSFESKEGEGSTFYLKMKRDNV